MMNKFAYAGQLHALHTLGLIPRESLEQVSPIAYMASGGQVGSPMLGPEYQGMFPGGYEHSVYTGEPGEQSRNWGRTIRKAGPGVGAALGGLAGLLLARRGGAASLKELAKGGFGGLAGGATLGWLPDITMSAGEAFTEDPNA
jgi:hypothetical protein